MTMQLGSMPGSQLGWAMSVLAMSPWSPPSKCGLPPPGSRACEPQPAAAIAHRRSHLFFSIRYLLAARDGELAELLVARPAGVLHLVQRLAHARHVLGARRG